MVVSGKGGRVGVGAAATMLPKSRRKRKKERKKERKNTEKDRQRNLKMKEREGMKE